MERPGLRWFAVGVLLLLMFGCGASNDCPPGFVRNATGDCVDPNAGPEDGDWDRSLNPCPDGWVLNAEGYCVRLPDGDGDGGNDGDLPDGDLDNEGLPDGDWEPPSCLDDGDCLIGTKCHSELRGGVCLPPCNDQDDCSAYENFFCNSEKRCAPERTEPGCLEDAHCPVKQICHSDMPAEEENGKNRENREDGDSDSDGENAETDGDLDTDPDTEALEGLDGPGESEAEAEEELPVLPGLCALPCDNSEQCDLWFSSVEGDLYCNSTHRCSVESGQGGCRWDEDCPVEEVCHPELNNGVGYCMRSCTNAWECTNQEPGTFCNSLRRCVPEWTEDGCETDAHCPYPDVCQTYVGADGTCLTTCSESGFCEYFDTSLWCNASGRCVPRETATRCDEDDDCPYGTVCHPEADADGVCAAPCDDNNDCWLIDSSLGCNAEYRCAPDIVITDGDEEIEPDADPDPEPVDGDEDSVVACVELGAGSVYQVDIPAARTTFIAKRGSAVYMDPSGTSSIFLRDNSTGNQFSVHTMISDGGALDPVEVIHGEYNVLARNRLGQRQTALEGVRITGDRTLEVPFQFHTITISLKKNGQEFPTLDSEFHGQLQLYDRSTRMTHVIGQTGTGLNQFNIDVFSSTYDILFEGCLTNDRKSYQTATLIASDQVTSDEQYAFNIRTVQVSGEVLFNGVTPSDVTGGRGEIWLKSVIKGDRFKFWSLGESGQATFSREVIADSYQIGFAPPGEDGEEYLWLAPETFDWSSSTSNEVLDLPRHRYRGEVLWKGDALYEHAGGEEVPDGDGEAETADDAYMDRGQIFLVNKATNERRKLVDLGRRGAASFDVRVGSGTYSLYFEGRLIDDKYFEEQTYPPSIHKLTFAEDLVIDRDTEEAVDLPIEEITGTIRKNGTPLGTVDFIGQYITVRREGGYEDLPMIHFKEFYGPNYRTLLFPGVYDMRFSGNFLVDRYQNFYVNEEFSVGPASNIFDINVNTRELRVEITANDGQKTLQELIDEDVFDTALIHIIDENVRNRTTGADYQNFQDNAGVFVLERPVGLYTVILHLRHGEHYFEIPLEQEFGLVEDRTLQADLHLTPISFELLKNGETLSDAQNTYSRGDIVFRDHSNYLVTISLDLGVQGAATGAFSIPVGSYTTNLSVGYGKAFDFTQWKYLDCVDVLTP